jgi:hypothetical protein
VDTSGLDVAKLKKLVFKKWQSAPELWPVKVISLDRLSGLERTNGGKLDRVGGYFTCLRAVRRKNPRQMEALLGFAPGFYSSGASIWRFLALPLEDQFELRGYTQLPGGNPFDGIVLRVAGSNRPLFFGKTGEELTYIPGLAVEQWELKPGFLMPAMEIARLGPDQQLLV